MFENINLIQVIVQGGSVGVAVLLILAGWRLADKFATLTTNHFVHFAALLSGIGEKLDRLIDATERHTGDHDGRSD